MTTIDISVSINCTKAKITLMRMIVDEFIAHGGRIFGGYVRDEFLRENDKKQFISRGYSIDQLYDRKLCHDLQNRFLVSKDIDVFFEKNNGKITFNNALRELERKGIKFLSDKFIKNCYSDKVEQYLVVASLMEEILPDLKINCKIDVLFGNVIGDLMIELDMECNGFILDQNGIYAFQCLTGGYSQVEVFLIEKQILDDILSLRTKCVHSKLTSFSNGANSFVEKEQNLIKRIIKMQCRGWKFTNLNYHVVENVDCASGCKNTQSVQFTCCNKLLCLKCLDKKLVRSSCQDQNYIGFYIYTGRIDCPFNCKT